MSTFFSVSIVLSTGKECGNGDTCHVNEVENDGELRGITLKMRDKNTCIRQQLPIFIYREWAVFFVL